MQIAWIVCYRSLAAMVGRIFEILKLCEGKQWSNRVLAELRRLRVEPLAAKV